MDYLGSSPPEVLALVRVIAWFKCKRPEKYHMCSLLLESFESLKYYYPSRLSRKPQILNLWILTKDQQLSIRISYS